MSEKILVIKHGALGDWVLATGAFKLIRSTHPSAKLILMTASPYLSLAQQTGWFDEVWLDNRKNFFETIKLLYKMYYGKFDYVYDMQRSQRTAFYHRVIKSQKLYWSGNILGSKGYFKDDLNKHIVERIGLQLQASHINDFPSPELSWLKDSIDHLRPSSPYALIIAGCAKHRPNKRWTAEGYVEIIKFLQRNHIQALLIGTSVDQEIIENIMSKATQFNPINLLNKTSFAQLAELARHAEFSIGSDTGSMHIAAITGQASLSLFCTTESKAQFNKPWGNNAVVIETENLQTLAPSKVIETCHQLLLRNKN